MINICAQRATVPDKLNHLCDEKIHLRNVELIKNYLAKYKNPLIWAAWGNLIEKRKYLSNFLKDIYEICKLYNSKWITFNNLTKKGHPRHPLYIPIESKMLEFDIEGYLCKGYFY